MRDVRHLVVNSSIRERAEPDKVGHFLFVEGVMFRLHSGHAHVGDSLSVTIVCLGFCWKVNYQISNRVLILM